MILMVLHFQFSGVELCSVGDFSGTAMFVIEHVKYLNVTSMVKIINVVFVLCNMQSQFPIPPFLKLHWLSHAEQQTSGDGGTVTNGFFIIQFQAHQVCQKCYQQSATDVNQQTITFFLLCDICQHRHLD